MGAHTSALLKLVLLVLMLVLAVISREQFGALGEVQLALAGYLPYLLFIVVAVLAFQFNRSRFLLVAGGTGACFWVVQTHLQVPLTEPGADEVFRAMALAWPLGALFLLLAPERGVLNRWGLVYATILVLLGLSAPRLLTLAEAALADYPAWLSTWPHEQLVMPLAWAALFAAVSLLALIKLMWRDDMAELALLSSLGAGFIILGVFHLPHISVALFIAAGLLQVTAIAGSSHAMAYRDELTGLLGRRALNEKLDGLGSRYSLAMLDVDHFKKFNDKFGHDVGDEVLKLVASRISKVGAGGTAFRYGGEEFCVVFPRKNIEQCVDALEAIREAVAGYQMTLRDKGQRPRHTKEGQRKRGSMATRVKSGTVSVTISLGLAERGEGNLTPEAVVKAADKQLYRAKQAGRNRLCY